MSKLEKALAEAGWEKVEVNDLEDIKPGDELIRPLRKVEKRPTYTIDMSEFGGGESIFSNDYFFTEAQAELVGDAVEALMEYIINPSFEIGGTYGRADNAADAAREALEGTNEL